MAHHLKWSNVGGFEVLGQLQGLGRATYVSDSLIIMQKRTLICSACSCSLGLSLFSHNNLEHEFKYLSSQTATLKSWIAIQLKFKRQTNKAKQSKLKPNRKGTWQTFFRLFLSVLPFTLHLQVNLQQLQKANGQIDTTFNCSKCAWGQRPRAVGGREEAWHVTNCWTWEVPRRGH